jgi:hypothetical protein
MSQGQRESGPGCHKGGLQLARGSPIPYTDFRATVPLSGVSTPLRHWESVHIGEA